MQRADSGENAAGVKRKALAGGAHAGGEKFRQVEGQPAVKRGGEGADEEGQHEEGRAEGIDAAEEHGAADERAEAEEEVGHAARDETADVGAEETADDGTDAGGHARPAFGGGIGGTGHLVGPEWEPLDGAPGADERDGRKRGGDERRLPEFRAENFFERVSLDRVGFDGGLPFFGLGNEEAHDEGEERGGGADERDPAPRIDRDLEENGDDGDEGETDVGGGADHAGHERAVFGRPDFHDEGDAERPFAAHAERTQEAGGAEVPRFLGEINQTGKDGVDENAGGHGADAADFVTEPAEDDATEGGADQERGGGVAHPERDKRVGQGDALRLLHLQESGTRDEGEEPHFHAVEHPAEEGGSEHGGEAGFVGRGGVGRGGVSHKLRRARGSVAEISCRETRSGKRNYFSKRVGKTGIYSGVSVATAGVA